ncbi:MAG: fused MFS/spermidine synthase [Syntrophorhabdaceae bacterium]
MSKKYTLEFIVFISGAIVMIYELVGSRLISPYFGTSIYVWTSLIGVILGSLSIGYHLGGKIADKKTQWSLFSGIIFLAAVFIGITVLMKNLILDFASLFNLRSEYTALLASIFLFAPASICLGMISPYSVKLKIKDLERSATTVGNLYAVSTVGSIVGTFTAGFFLIPFFGTTKILFFLVALLVFLSSMAYWRSWLRMKIAILVFLGFASFAFNSPARTKIIEVDTPYNKVWLDYSVDERNRKKITLHTDPFAAQSAMYVNDNELVFKYTRFFRLAKHFNPNIHKALMLGGSGYSYPKDFLAKFPDAAMDVVEIDPGMTKIARQYFRLEDNPRLTIFHEDARTFLNKNKKTYDVIYGDAFNSFSSVPYQLATREAIEKMYAALNENGLVIHNIISAIEGKKGEFLRAEIATYKVYFPRVYVFRVDNEDSREAQNIVLIALKNAAQPALSSPDKELNGYLGRVWKREIQLDMPVITDDHAPVEYYKFRSM